MKTQMFHRTEKKKDKVGKLEKVYNAVQKLKLRAETRKKEAAL